MQQTMKQQQQQISSNSASFSTSARRTIGTVNAAPGAASLLAGTKYMWLERLRY
jgi:hypothetical protein